MVGIFLKHSQFNITKPLQKKIFRPPMIANPHQQRTSDLLTFRQDAEVNQLLAPLLRSQLVTTDRGYLLVFRLQNRNSE